MLSHKQKIVTPRQHLPPTPPKDHPPIMSPERQSLTPRQPQTTIHIGHGASHRSLTDVLGYFLQVGYHLLVLHLEHEGLKVDPVGWHGPRSK